MKKPETLAEYTYRVMREEGISASEVERRARKEAESRGLEETHKLSDATVGNVVLEKTGNIGIYTLTALAWGLGRPVEEVVKVALGISGGIIGESEIVGLSDAYQGLPADEKKYFSRQIETMRREMQTVKRQKK